MMCDPPADRPVPERTLIVDEEAAGTRLDRFLAERLPDVSRTRLQVLIREGEVRVDGERARPSSPMREGARVSWPADAGFTTITLEPEDVPIEAVYEDEDLLVLHKPAGQVVHPAPGHWHGTLVHGLLQRWPGWRAPGGADRPGIVHRLDKDTTGLMLVARSARAYRSLTEQIAAHTVERAYVALAWGVVSGEQGRVEAAIGRDPRRRQRMAVVAGGGRPAQTEWNVLARFDTLTLLRLVLRTGRTHQVRVHLAHLGHPVFGDPLYGGTTYATRLTSRERTRGQRLLRTLSRQALHAYRLGFRHPADGEWLAFEAPVPEDMEAVLRELSGRGGMNEGDDAKRE